MKVYISGRISGQDIDEAKAKFSNAARQVESLGHEAVNPFDSGVEDNAHWNQHMVADIAMLLECDGIYLLKDWNHSKGARIEASIAKECGLEIILQPDISIV